MVILIEHPLFHGDFSRKNTCFMVILAGDFDICSWKITCLMVIPHLPGEGC